MNVDVDAGNQLDMFRWSERQRYALASATCMTGLTPAAFAELLGADDLDAIERGDFDPVKLFDYAQAADELVAALR
ncbi:MAG: hypothetical protein ACR2RB_19835 [Gammaproteobacteria bacterium]